MKWNSYKLIWFVSVGMMTILTFSNCGPKVAPQSAALALYEKNLSQFASLVSNSYTQSPQYVSAANRKLISNPSYAKNKDQTSDTETADTVLLTTAQIGANQVIQYMQASISEVGSNPSAAPAALAWMAQALFQLISQIPQNAVAFAQLPAASQQAYIYSLSTYQGDQTAFSTAATASPSIFDGLSSFATAH